MIFNDDTLIIANKLYLSTKSNILVLNMASEYKAGGGVENGAMAQEEELFRRSNYFESLTPNLYPIKEFEAVYTKDVCIFKDVKIIITNHHIFYRKYDDFADFLKL